jgi:hypothetical protein
MKNTILIIALFFISQLPTQAQNYRYVSVNGAGNQNGTSWSNAYSASDIQTAIDALDALGGGEVWIAAGTYYPTVAFDNTTTDNSKKSISLKSNVHLYGGFAGSESAKSQRTNFGEGQTNESILSGDLGVANTISDNSYYVVYVASGVNAARLDGLTIQDGNADAGSYNDGGGIYCATGNFTAYNCVIKDNHADDNGGGMFIAAKCVIDSCTIYSNTSGAEGAGVYTLYWTYYTSPVPTIKNCLIYNNVSSSDGGGIYI